MCDSKTADDGQREDPCEIPQDNWKHRSSNMSCLTCMWFVPKITHRAQMYDRVIGRCRRNAPTMSGFPVVYANDWCGQHKIDENK